MKKAIIVACASVFLFACGGEEEEETTVDAGTTKVDAGTKTDAGTTTTTDAGTNTTDAGTEPGDCPLASDLGTLAAGTGYETYETMFAGTTDVWGTYALSDETGYISLELYKTGVFANGFVTGTFDLDGDELNYETCGLCVLVNGFVGETSVKPYMATGGQVKLDSFSGRLTGELINVTFEEVTILEDQPFTSTPVPNGCETKIVSMPFDDALVEYDDAK